MKFSRTLIGSLLILTLTGCSKRSDPTEEMSVKAVERVGGKIERDDSAPDKPVVRVILKGKAVTDAEVKELVGLKQLKDLRLIETGVTAAGLKELTGLKELEKLMLLSTPITDAGVKELAALTQLQYLDLNFTQVTDAGLKEFSRLNVAVSTCEP